MPFKTVLHHIKNPWRWKGRNQSYYFCDAPDCEVVYFGEDNSTVTSQDLRTPIGKKDNTEKAILCYCFGVSLKDALGNNQVKEFVSNMTKQRLCDCEIRNPSGKCCLKDFPKS